MDFRFSEEEEKFRLYVRQFLKENMNNEVRQDTIHNHSGGPNARILLQKAAKAGLLGLCWPKEYGGKELPATYEFIVSDEGARVGMPEWPSIKLCGHTLITHGSEYLKREYLPKILSGEGELCIGFTEPEAGSDLGSLKLRAVEDGDDFVINGQKVFTTAAHVSEWVWLLARTDPGEGKHRGASLFIVDLQTPGITIRPMYTMDGGQTNEIFYDDVRVPKRQLVGERGRGFYYAMAAVQAERHLVFPTARSESMLDRLIEWARETKRNGVPVSKDPIVRHTIARLAAEVETSRGLELKVLDYVQKGLISEVWAAMHKLYGTQLEQRIHDTGMNLMGAYGQLRSESKHVKQEGEFEVMSRRAVVWTIGGGTSEVQKNIIARAHLHLPQ